MDSHIAQTLADLHAPVPQVVIAIINLLAAELRLAWLPAPDLPT